MIDPRQFADLVLRPVLVRLGMHSPAAEKLLMGTFAHESTVGGNTMLKQVRGPALGVFQIEPATYDDLFENFLEYRRDLRQRLRGFEAPWPADPLGQLVGNLPYACAVARLIYYRAPEALPDHGDVEALAGYWKRFYNTEQGAGTIPAWIMRYRETVQPIYPD